MRQASLERQTNETSISVEINLDGTGRYDNETGVGFFDHMLDQLSRHSLIDMKVRTEGDLHIDAHHTVEDTGIALGQAISQVLGDKRGINRYGHCYLPMDETLSRAALDLSNRPFLVWKVNIRSPMLGDMDTELAQEFFQALAQNAGITLHIENLYGTNSHHIVESIFKAVARALRMAIETDARSSSALPSTKGAL